MCYLRRIRVADIFMNNGNRSNSRYRNTSASAPVPHWVAVAVSPQSKTSKLEGALVNISKVSDSLNRLKFLLTEQCGNGQEDDVGTHLRVIFGEEMWRMQKEFCLWSWVFEIRVCCMAIPFALFTSLLQAIGVVQKAWFSRAGLHCV